MRCVRVCDFDEIVEEANADDLFDEADQPTEDDRNRRDKKKKHQKAYNREYRADREAHAAALAPARGRGGRGRGRGGRGRERGAPRPRLPVGEHDWTQEEARAACPWSARLYRDGINRRWQIAFGNGRNRRDRSAGFILHGHNGAARFMLRVAWERHFARYHERCPFEDQLND